jgi:hypothetical protein
MVERALVVITVLVAGDEARIDAYAAYYITQILRSPAAHERFCHPLRAE